VSFHRHVEGPDPVRTDPIVRPAQLPRVWRLGTGTLACPHCDAPVAPAAGGMSPADPLACPFCRHGGAVRDFLSLAAPSRPARVAVRVVPRGALR
jgi:hypothetical protein